MEELPQSLNKGPGSLHFIFQSYVFNANAEEAMKSRLTMDPGKQVP